MKRTDIMETIRELKEMFFAGAITEEEFQRLKMEFLEEMNLLPTPSASPDATPVETRSPGRQQPTPLVSVPSRRSSSDPFIPKAKTSPSIFQAQKDGPTEVKGVPIATATPIPNTLATTNSAAHSYAANNSSLGGQASGHYGGAQHASYGPAEAPVDDRQQQFMSLYTRATQQAAEQPERALRYMEEARVLAPDLVDEVFRQWMQYAQYMLHQKRQAEAQQFPSHNNLQASQGSVSGSHMPYASARNESTNPGFEMPKSLATPLPQDVAEQEDPVSILLEGVNDLLNEEDFSGALVLLEHLKQEFPNTDKIESLYELCKSKLQEDYQERFEHASSVFPAMTCSPAELIEMQNQFDHKMGFLLSQIDGQTSLSQLIMITGLDEFEVFRVLETLEDRGVLSVEKK